MGDEEAGRKSDAAERVNADQPAQDAPAPDAPAPDAPAPGQPEQADLSDRSDLSDPSDVPAADEPAPDEPAPDKPAVDEPAPDEPAADEPAPGQPEQTDLSDPSDSSDSAARDLPPEVHALCRSAIEAMLFSSAEPVNTRKLADALRDTGIDGRGVRRIVRELAAEYDEQKRGFSLEEVAGGFRMLTRMDYADYVGALQGTTKGGKLSQAALETLAVVAYKQPVTRADIEAIRGVQAGPLLRTLLDKGLVKIAGRAELLGRPLLYGTTRRFLEHFGLRSLNELPKVEELPKP